MEKKINEDSPEGWTGTVKAMLKHHKGDIDNPYALAHWMKKHGEKPHYKVPKDDKSTGPGEPQKKEKYKDEDEPKEKKGGKRKKFKEWLAEAHPEGQTAKPQN
jgi:hypothetical protein